MIAPTARPRRGSALAGAAVLIAALGAWGVHHIAAGVAAANGAATGAFQWVFALAFVMLVWQLALCYMERPYRGRLDRTSYVVVNVPVYNENPSLLRACLASLLTQHRLPNEVHVVDDGTVGTDYADVRAWFLSEAAEAGVHPDWVRTENRGKRHAQGVTVARTPQASIYMTVDSDAVLEERCIAEGLKPFGDARVQSVAGVVLAMNNRVNLLARLTDLWFVTGQLVDRSAMSVTGSVLVNSGVAAWYRAELLRDNLDGYLNETFFGRPVEFSDDSMLTIYALQRGRAVQQPTAFAFTMMPENLNHHARQQLRWMRGAFIRSWWRFRYLPLRGYAFWGHLMGWVQFGVSTVVFAALFIVIPLTEGSFDPLLFAVPVLIGYGMSLRYLGVARSDQSLGSQLRIFALSPLASLWSFFVLRPIRWYAMATCLRTGWGTREKVEVVLRTTKSADLRGSARVATDGVAAYVLT